MYTFSFIVGNIIPKNVKCIHSATYKLIQGCMLSLIRSRVWRLAGEDLSSRGGDPCSKAIQSLASNHPTSYG